MTADLADRHPERVLIARWTCKACGVPNHGGNEHCIVCGIWREGKAPWWMIKGPPRAAQD